MRYELLVSGDVLRHNADGSESYIPSAESNSDYRAYLLWVAAGNVALVRAEPAPIASDAPVTRAEVDAIKDAIDALMGV